MDIAVIRMGGEIEEEFSVEMCCTSCTSQKYGWSKQHHLLVQEFLDNKEPMPVPDHIDSVDKFTKYIASLSL